MLSVIRRRLTYANVAVSLALVFAMSGGAYAAGRYVITSTRQISPKVLKALKGANGKAGASGVQGPAGPAGPTGLQGAAGARGENGAAGKEGPPGKNGENGKNGTTSFTETLPPGKTLRGEWNLSENVSAPSKFVISSVSFGIPLASVPTAVYVRAHEAAPEGCIGNSKEPGAEPGHLCVFADNEENTETEAFPSIKDPAICPLGKSTVAECLFGAEGRGAEPSGFGIETLSHEAGYVDLSGTWVVTAAEE